MLKTTSTQLLSGLKDPANNAAWEEFCARYTPVLVSFGCRLGLSDADAQDAAQETFIAFAQAHRNSQFDRTRGRLRSWMFGVAQRKVRDIQRRDGRTQPRLEQSTHDRGVEEVAQPDHWERIWEEEWRRAVINQCIALVRRDVAASTMAAFEQITLAQRPVAEAAAALGLSKAAAARANQRVLSRMRELHRIIEVDW